VAGVAEHDEPREPGADAGEGLLAAGLADPVTDGEPAAADGDADAVTARDSALPKHH